MTALLSLTLFVLTMTVRDRSSLDAMQSPSPSPVSAATITGMAIVTDGDSLRISNQKIRLWAIDAPELQQTCQQLGVSWPCGAEAMVALTEHIGSHSVSCRKEDIDRYGRIVAECFIGDSSINEWLVGNGWALAYRQYSAKFTSAEDQAKSRKSGLWQGEFIAPWDWRQQQR